MDPPLISESSFSAANPSAYTLAEIWPFSGNEVQQSGNGNGGGNGGLGLRMGSLGGFVENNSVEESTVTEQSGGGNGGNGGRKRRDVSSEDESSKLVSTTTSGNDMNNSNGKRAKVDGSKDENGGSKAEAEASSAAGSKQAEESTKLEPPKDYIHVRARRGQATDSHSLAERARREKISERMKILQDLVPGCTKVIGKALVLDEIINYIQSLQRQVEFLSMKLEAVNSRMSIPTTMEGFPPKDLGMQPFDASGMMFGSQETREYPQGPQPEWLHMQLGGSFGRTS